MSGCIEVDGLGLLSFYDGENQITYETYALGVRYPGNSNDLVLAFNEMLDKVRRRSKIIYWRRRPLLRFGQAHVADTEWIDMFKKGEEIISISCRLACYPPLNDEEKKRIPFCKQENQTIDLLTTTKEEKK